MSSTKIATRNMGSGTQDTTTFLRGDGTWSIPTASSTPPVVTLQTGSVTLGLNSVNKFDITGNTTSTLPTAVGNSGANVIVQWNSGSYTLSMATTSSQTIEGSLASSIQFNRLGQSYTFVSDGSNWIIL
jgi:hypothetical protein